MYPTKRIMRCYHAVVGRDEHGGQRRGAGRGEELSGVTGVMEGIGRLAGPGIVVSAPGWAAGCVSLSSVI